MSEKSPKKIGQPQFLLVDHESAQLFGSVFLCFLTKFFCMMGLVGVIARSIRSASLRRKNKCLYTPETAIEHDHCEKFVGVSGKRLTSG